MITTTADSPATTATDSLRTTLDRDFRTACEEFTEARAQRARKDTPGHRTAVADSLSRIDAVLDMYLASRTAR